MTLQVVNQSRQSLTCLLLLPNQKPFYYSAIYASNEVAERTIFGLNYCFFTLLLISIVESGWYGGDFNQNNLTSWNFINISLNAKRQHVSYARLFTADSVIWFAIYWPFSFLNKLPTGISHSQKLTQPLFHDIPTPMQPSFSNSSHTIPLASKTYHSHSQKLAPILTNFKTILPNTRSSQSWFSTRGFEPETWATFSFESYLQKTLISDCTLI